MCHRVSPTGRIELVEELPDMELCGVDGDAEAARNALIGRAFSEQQQHLVFTRRQCFQPIENLIQVHEMRIKGDTF